MRSSAAEGKRRLAERLEREVGERDIDLIVRGPVMGGDLDSHYDAEQVAEACLKLRPPVGRPRDRTAPVDSSVAGGDSGGVGDPDRRWR